MKLTLRQSWQSVSVERRWAVTGAGPLDSYLLPRKQFVPADVLMSVGVHAKLNSAIEPYTSVYAWPAENEKFTSARLSAGSLDTITGPSWVEGLQQQLRAELLGDQAPAFSHDVELREQHASRGSGIHEYWGLDGAPLIGGRQPNELEVGWILSDGQPGGEQARYRATLRDDIGIIDDTGGLLEHGWKIEHQWVTEVADAALARLMLSPLDPAKLLVTK